MRQFQFRGGSILIGSPVARRASQRPASSLSRVRAKRVEAEQKTGWRQCSCSCLPPPHHHRNEEHFQRDIPRWDGGGPFLRQWQRWRSGEPLPQSCEAANRRAPIFWCALNRFSAHWTHVMRCPVPGTPVGLLFPFTAVLSQQFGQLMGSVASAALLGVGLGLVRRRQTQVCPGGGLGFGCFGMIEKKGVPSIL